MLKISKFTVEGMREGCVTDCKQPKFAYTVECFGQDVTLTGAVLTVGEWKAENVEPTGIRYAGPALKPYTTYEAVLKVKASTGEEAESSLRFETGRMGAAWKANWISDPVYKFTEKKVSPIPMSFRKALSLKAL